MVHISAVIEEAVENPFIPSTHRLMVQDLNSGLTQIRNSMLALASINNPLSLQIQMVWSLRLSLRSKKNKKLLSQSFWHSPKDQTAFLLQLLTKIALRDISKPWKNHFKMAWLWQLQTGEAHQLTWSGSMEKLVAVDNVVEIQVLTQYQICNTTFQGIKHKLRYQPVTCHQNTKTNHKKKLKLQLNRATCHRIINKSMWLHPISAKCQRNIKTNKLTIFLKNTKTKFQQTPFQQLIQLK